MVYWQGLKDVIITAPRASNDNGKRWGVHTWCSLLSDSKTTTMCSTSTMHVRGCSCEECLNPGSEPAVMLHKSVNALCDECRPAHFEIRRVHIPRKLKCKACGLVGVQGRGIEAVWGYGL